MSYKVREKHFHCPEIRSENHETYASNLFIFAYKYF